MKRKITELEQMLIAENFKLEGKVYRGKRFEKVFYYEYVRHNEVIRLDAKREKVIQVGIKNVNIPMMSDIELEHLRARFWNLKSFANSLTETPKPISHSDVELNDLEMVKSLTPEELDELCKERE